MAVHMVVTDQEEMWKMDIVSAPSGLDKLEMVSDVCVS